ncbi:MAG TPA: MBL fold metallo-hydrolase [Kiritimatiellia bacterium]|jgi:glyoxylase-like metal-dependent hydrolase (beta-lactamase superfamily II)
MRITPLIASTFRSDGGSMFGLVPRPIWAKRIPPDERHRIPQNANVLLVELDDKRRGLVDTGCGSAEHFSGKEIDLHGLGPGWPLMENLARLGVAPDQIDFVLHTHLHWDHAGGAVSGGRPVFPRATHYVHRREWEDAASGNPLLFKSYPAEIVDGFAKIPERRRVLVGDDTTIAPGVRMSRSGGHTFGHCVIVLEDPSTEIVLPSGNRKAPDLCIYAGDVCPTRHHLRMVFQTSYDTFPLDTRAWKRNWLPRLAERKGLLFFDHDPDVFAATIAADPREEFAVTSTLPCAGT